MSAYSWAMWLVALSACSSSEDPHGPIVLDDAGARDESAPDTSTSDAADADTLTYAPTFSAIWREVLAPTCASAFCHGGDGLGLMMSNQQAAYDDLVHMRAAGPDCAGSGLVLVEPSHPESSLLYQKITTPSCGRAMPLGLPHLSTRTIEQIRQWIAAGAAND